MSMGQSVARKVEVTVAGAKFICASRADAEVVLAVSEVFHSGNGTRKMPRGSGAKQIGVSSVFPAILGLGKVMWH